MAFAIVNATRSEYFNMIVCRTIVRCAQWANWFVGFCKHLVSPYRSGVLLMPQDR
jgi:hypothetical protein